MTELWKDVAGYEEMQRALQQRLRRQMRELMADALENAKQNLFAAQRLLGHA